MPQTLTIIVRKPFPHRAGLGADAQVIDTQSGHRGRSGYWGGTLPPSVNAVDTTTTTATDGSSTTTPGVSSHPGRRGRPTSYSAPAASAQQVQQTVQSTAPTQADLNAFSAALSNAVALGVITSAQAAQYQSAASTSTDAQLNSLTNQIVALAATSTPATVATASTAAATTTTSWWSGTTTLFGSAVSNSTLTIGAGLLAVLGYAFFKKK